jgi:hypothetical protein
MDALVRAAVAGEVKVFVGDVPSVLYYLAQTSGGEKFRQTTGGQIVNKQYSAVRKGDTETLRIVQSGFDRISPSEVDAIVAEWAGYVVSGRVPWREIGWGRGVPVDHGMILLWNLHCVGGFRATRDIEEEHRRTIEAQKATEGSERNYQACLSRLHRMSWRSPDRTVASVNRKMCDITVFREEMLTMRVSDITHPIDRERDWELFSVSFGATNLVIGSKCGTSAKLGLWSG